MEIKKEQLNKELPPALYELASSILKFVENTERIELDKTEVKSDKKGGDGVNEAKQ